MTRGSLKNDQEVRGFPLWTPKGLSHFSKGPDFTRVLPSPWIYFPRFQLPRVSWGLKARDPPSACGQEVSGSLNAMSQCLRHSPHFVSSHWHFINSHHHKKGEYGIKRYLERERERERERESKRETTVTLTFITVHCYNCCILLLLITCCV